MTRDEILERISTIIKRICKREEVNPDDSILDDLDMESIEVFVMLGQVEMEYGAVIPVWYLRKIDTVDDLVQAVETLAGGPLVRESYEA